jgi:hypothetical protein
MVKGGNNIMHVDILMDSGAYSVMTKGEEINIDKYIQFIKDCGTNITAAISLDVIGDGDETYSRWKYMQRKGVETIPTYHLSTDVKFLERYIEETDYVGIGGVAGVTTSRTAREAFNMLWREVLTDSDGFPLVKIHAMGITDVTILTDFPFYSIDSSTWLMTSRRGIIIIPGLDSKEPDYLQAKRVEVSSKSPHRKKRGQHLENLGEMQKEMIMNFITEKGFIIGSSKQNEFGETLNNEKGKEDIIERGLCNDWFPRDCININFFLNLEERLKSWPWSWPSKKTSYQLQLTSAYDSNIAVPKRNFPKGKTRIYLAGEGVKEYDIFSYIRGAGFTNYRRMLAYPFRKAKVLKDFNPLFEEIKNEIK